MCWRLPMSIAIGVLLMVAALPPGEIEAAGRNEPVGQDGRGGHAGRVQAPVGVSERGGFRPDAGTGNDSDAGSLRDYVVLDDLIVDGSGCFGNDCVNGEAFGFDTIRLRENNLRVKFDDTSSISGYPDNDWEITINDSQNGGINRFSIMDVTGGRTPFTIRAGAPNDALYVDPYGRVGIGTGTPATEIHMQDSDTPTLRLQQDGTGGWTPQTWDVAGNESNFFVRDATHGSQLPLRIFPGAPTNSFTIAATGDVGIGTSSPEAALHVEGALLMKGLTAAPTVKVARDTVATFALDENGNVFLGGVLFEASSRHSKQLLAPVDAPAVLERLGELELWEWTYLHDDLGARHVGPLAEEFAAVFGLGADSTHVAAMDVSGVALSAVCALVEQHRRKDAKIAELEARLADHEAQRSEGRDQLEDLLARLQNIESRMLER